MVVLVAQAIMDLVVQQAQVVERVSILLVMVVLPIWVVVAAVAVASLDLRAARVEMVASQAAVVVEQITLHWEVRVHVDKYC